MILRSLTRAPTLKSTKISCHKNPKMCDPILVTLLKMRPHYSQSSRENATHIKQHIPISLLLSKLCSLSRSLSRIMLHVNSHETTFKHQRVPAARFINIFLKLFDRHATCCYIQVDLKCFLASGAFFFRPRSDRASYDFASNKF